jgi:hypothetical protein
MKATLYEANCACVRVTGNYNEVLKIDALNLRAC